MVYVGQMISWFTYSIVYHELISRNVINMKLYTIDSVKRTQKHIKWFKKRLLNSSCLEPALVALFVTFSIRFCGYETLKFYKSQSRKKRYIIGFYFQNVF